MATSNLGGGQGDRRYNARTGWRRRFLMRLDLLRRPVSIGCALALSLTIAAAAPTPRFADKSPSAIAGRRRAGDRGRRLLLDGPGRAGAAARGLRHGADLARIHAGAARGRQRQDRHHLFRMGRPVRPEDHHAVAADRRAGIGRRGRRRDRARALPARLAHLDFRRAAPSPSRCSTTAAIAACAG